MSVLLWHDVDKHGTRGLVGGALSLDKFSVFLTVLICGSAALTCLFLDDYLRREQLDVAEVHALVLLAAIGGVVMAMSSDLIVLFLGLETLSIALYVLAGSHIRRGSSQESAIKYFVLGGFASAFFLYGIALIYGATGSTNLGRIAGYLAGNTVLKGGRGLLMAGFALMLVGLAFKVAAAPFHMWTPDVYQGSPSPITGFMASAAKAAAFGALLRVFVIAFATHRSDWRPVLFVLAVLTLVVGSVAAVVQTNVKRMLAYSSISHAGFIMVGVTAASAKGVSGSLFYLMAYAVMVLGTFGVVTLVGKVGDEDHSLDAYKGLGERRPVLALVFTGFLLAQAGVPFTSGFWAKLGVIGAAVEAAGSKSDTFGYGYVLAVVAMVCAAIAAYLYLRIVKTMYFDEPDADATRPTVPLSAGVALGLALAFTFVIGVAPGMLLNAAQHALPVLAGR
jgi:NADH-quinone oxidoreductase subunit N